MRTFFYFILTLSFLYQSQDALAQTTEEAPSLSIGLDKMIFSKGTIDVEVLSNIISKKQDELKKELVKRAILGFLGEGSFTFQNYGENVLKLVLNEKNKQVLTREILEYTSNLALVYGFTELYLQLGVKTNNRLLIDIVTTHFDLVKTVNPTFQESGLVKYLRKIKAQGYRKKKLPSYNKLFLLGELKHNPITLTNCGCSNTKLYGLNHILLDMVFDICKNEDIVQKKGFFLQALNIDQEYYQSQNKYLTLDSICSNIRFSNDTENVKAEQFRREIIRLNKIKLKDCLSIERVEDSLKKYLNDQEIDNPFKSLFVPSTKALNSIIDKYNFFLEDKLRNTLQKVRDKLNTISISYRDNLIKKLVDTSLISSKLNTLDTRKLIKLASDTQAYLKLLSTYKEIEIVKKVDNAQKKLDQDINDYFKEFQEQVKKWKDDGFGMLKSKGLIKHIPSFAVAKGFSNISKIINVIKDSVTKLTLHQQTQKKAYNSKLNYLLYLSNKICCNNDIQQLKEKVANAQKKAAKNIKDLNEKIDQLKKDSTNQSKKINNLNQKVKQLKQNTISDQKQKPEIDKIDQNIKILKKNVGTIIKQVDSLRKKITQIKKDSLYNEKKILKAKDCCKFKYALYKEQLKLIRIKKKNTISLFFKFFGILKETNFLRGNTLEKIEGFYKKYLKEEAEGIKKVRDGLVNKVQDLKKLRENLNANVRSLESKIRIRLSKFTPEKRNSIKQKLDVFQTRLERDSLTSSKLEEAKVAVQKAKATLDEINRIRANATTNRNFVQIAEKLASLNENLNTLKNLKHPSQIIQNIFTNNQIITNGQSLTINDSKRSEQTKKVKDTEKKLERLENQLRSSNDSLKIFQQSDLYFKLNIQNLKDALLAKTFKELKDTNRDLLAKVYEAISKLENPNKKYNDLSFANYILDSLNSQLAKFSYLDEGVQKAVKSFELIASQIKLDLLGEFRKAFNDLKDINFVNPSQFIDFITKLNQLDKAETYDYLFKVLIDIGNNFVKKEHSLAFNSIVNNVKKYTEIIPDSSSINVDVEQIIVDLYDRYGNNSKAVIVPYFSIGLNQAYPFIRGTVLSPSDTLNNLGFAGEKIGIKFRPHFLNYKKKYNEKLKTAFVHQKQPFVSDIHLILYGSGLLYNLANAKTNKNFDGSIIGTSAGVSFFNGLDFNLGVAFPIVNRGFVYEDIMFNIGFDIKITEYIQGVREKRRLAKAKRQE